MLDLPFIIVILLIGLFSGLVAGGALGWLLAGKRQKNNEARQREEKLKIQKELFLKREDVARLQAALKAREELAKERDAARAELKNEFEALAAKALKVSGEQFLELAELRFQSSGKQATFELDKRKLAIVEMLKPVAQNLEKLGEATWQLEVKREKAYGELSAQLADMGRATRELHESASSLSHILKGGAEARGRWGEMALRNIVEMAGMTEHCDFEVQSTILAGRRPDMVVKLPGSGMIPVDAKTPFVHYEAYMSTSDHNRRMEHLKAHEAALRTQIKELGQRDYAGNLKTDVDFTVLFLPAESMLAAAFDVNPNLGEDALQKRVLLATPVTLIALLRTVSIYWRQEKLAENAGRVLDAARTFYERVSTFQNHLSKIGRGLNTTVQTYNKAVGAYTSRIVPAGRRLEELAHIGEVSNKLGDVEELDSSPRYLETELSSGAK